MVKFKYGSTNNEATGDLLVCFTLPLVEVLLSPELLLSAKLLSLDLLSFGLVDSLDQNGLVLELVS